MTYLHNEIVSVRLEKESFNSIDPMLRMKRELRRAHEKYFYAQFLSDSSLVKMATSIISPLRNIRLSDLNFMSHLNRSMTPRFPLLSLAFSVFKKMKANDFFCQKKWKKKA